MAQFKEYSKNDFLYSTQTDIANDISCNKTDVEWDDLIFDKCTKYTTDVTISINGHTYKQTPIDDSANTIKQLANDFTTNSPYKFYYEKTNLKISGAKIQFSGSNTAGAILGYEATDTSAHQLPYIFPNAIKTVYDNSRQKTLYQIGAVGAVGITINGATIPEPTDDNYNTADTMKGYTNPILLVNYLNSIKIGYKASNTTMSVESTLYYKFEYDSFYDKIKVVDLFCENHQTLPMFSANTDYYKGSETTLLPLSQFVESVGSVNTDPVCASTKKNKALCDNKKSAESIMTAMANQPGANQRYLDAQGFSDTSMLNIFNLGIGIIGAAVFISNTYK